MGELVTIEEDAGMPGRRSGDVRSIVSRNPRDADIAEVSGALVSMVTVRERGTKNESECNVAVEMEGTESMVTVRDRDDSHSLLARVILETVTFGT